MRSAGKQLLLLLMLLLAAGTAAAKETLESVLSRAAAQQNIRLDYREVRHMQLLNDPWQAEGRMFVSATAFVIEQQAPQPRIIAANRTRFWIFLPQKNIRHTGMLTTPMAKKSFGLFKPIMRGDQAALDKEFNIAFSATEDQWELELLPKQRNTAIKKISIQGRNDQPAYFMKTEMSDGDFTEWFFQTRPAGPAFEADLQALIDRARGG